MKFKTEIKKLQMLVKARTSLFETIDVDAMGRFSKLCYRGLLHFFLKPEIINKSIVKYSGISSISLSERLQIEMNKTDFLIIIEQFVVAIQELEKNGFDLSGLVLDFDNIYFNTNTKEVQFIYLAIKGENNENDIMEVLKNIAYSIKPAVEKDQDYLFRFLNFIDAKREVNPEWLEHFISIEDSSIVNIIKNKKNISSGYITNKPKEYYEHYGKLSENTNIENNLANSAISNVLIYGAPTNDLVENQTTLINANATALLQDEKATGNENKVVFFPILYRVKNGEEIKVDKLVFRIGKAISSADYLILDNKCISRKHADIISRGKHYYLKDLNSLNKTYLNSKVLLAEKEYEIYEGDRIKLADEEFIFYYS